jgi:hypothetical protein
MSIPVAMVGRDVLPLEFQRSKKQKQACGAFGVRGLDVICGGQQLLAEILKAG